jgi:hypothetical protein
MRLQLNRSIAAPAAVLSAIVLNTVSASAVLGTGPGPVSLPGGCGPRPSWIAGASLPQERENPFGACFSASESQAGVVLSVANNRPYAQLITIRGGVLEVSESSFASPLEGALARLLTNPTAGEGPYAFLLAPRHVARIRIDRPPPGPGEVVHIDAASDNAFAVGALAWRFLDAAASERVLPAATESCVAGAVEGTLSNPPHPQRALRRMHACVNASARPGSAWRPLRALAGRLLRDSYFEGVIRRQGAELHRARVVFTIAPTNPNLRSPSIHLTSTNLGTLQSGQRTVEHLTAAGGAPPYRFYFVPERGGPGVPVWVHLVPDGTLIVEPPLGVTSVRLQVEVVDSDGEHSLFVE